LKIEPGICGCGVPDTDSDGDGTPDCMKAFYFMEDFEHYSAGDNPADWFDTKANNSMIEDNNLFKVYTIDNNNVFGTTSTLSNIHSHFMGPKSADLSAFEHSGRMLMTDAKGSIGVTFLSQYPLTDAYYRLRSINGSSFHISAHPNGKEVFGVVDSGVIPAINQWYRFRIQVQDSGIHTEILAKVWNESLPEPSDWQINAYDDTSTRLVAGTFGLWSYSSGYKYWDDLKIATTLEPATYIIIASAGTGGSISPDGNVAVTLGAIQSFTITPDIGQKIKDVLVDEVSVGAVDTYSFTNVTSNRTISVTFETIVNTNPDPSESNTSPKAVWLEFDGVDDKAVVKDSGSLDITNFITLEAWIKADSIPSSGKKQARVVSKSLNYELTIYSGDTGCVSGTGDVQWRAIIGGTDRRICGGSIEPGAWHHIAGTYDGSEFVLYMDGNPVASTLRSGLIGTNSDDLIVGNHPSLNRPFDGSIDEVRLWSVARTHQEIQENMNRELSGLERGLVAYYNLNEGFGQEIIDGTVYRNNGVLGSTPGLDVDDPVWRVVDGSINTKTQVNDGADQTIILPDDTMDFDGKVSEDNFHFMELGEVSINHIWKRESFNQPFLDPVVIAKPASSNDPNPAVVRIRNVDQNRFRNQITGMEQPG
jgi:hypothetical protein